MPAVHLTGAVSNISGRIFPSGFPPYKTGIIPVRNKADILAVGFVSIDKSVFLRKCPDLGLFHLSEREQNMRELFLFQIVKDIRLILFVRSGIGYSLFQQPASVFLTVFCPCVMPGGDIVAVKRLRTFQKRFKLDIAVAVYTGIWRHSLLIACYEAFYHLFTEQVFHIVNIMHYIKP